MTSTPPLRGLPGLTFEVSPPPRPPTFETDVPVFLGRVAKDPARRELVSVSSAAEFDQRFGITPGYLSDAVACFFQNGGRRAHIAVHPDLDDEALDARLDEIFATLRERLDIDLLCAPDLADSPMMCRKLVEALAESDDLDRGAPLFGILDVPPKGFDHPPGYRPLSERCAFYGPWILTSCRPCRGQGCAQCESSGSRPIPPSGAIAGTFARVGPGVAPANIRLEEVSDVASLPSLPDDWTFNRLLALPGRGIRAWGASTLTDRDIAALRLIQTVERWARFSLEAVTFEPLIATLGPRVRRNIEAMLLHLFHTGRLAGATPADAFLVVCDERNNQPANRDRGELVVDIHLNTCRTLTQVHVHLVRTDGRVITAVDVP